MAAPVLEPDEAQGVPAAAPVLSMLSFLSATRSGIEARLIEATTVAVAACGDEILVVKGFTSVAELTAAQTRKWRTEAKAAAVAELQATLGMGQEEARHLVALACAPAPLRVLVIQALDAGRVTWWQVRMFWKRCAKLPVEAALLIAQGLFGDDPALAAKDRFSPGGDLREGPWDQGEYRQALDREATRAEGADVTAERARRRAAYAARQLTLTAHEDGTGTLTLTTDLVRLCAVHHRIDRAARLLRKHGNGRTLDQLRSDVATTLLVHGLVPAEPAAATETPTGQTTHDTTPTPEHTTAPLVSPDLLGPDLEHLARVVNAMPHISVQVIIPWDTLTGAPTCPRCEPTCTEHGTPCPPAPGGGAVGRILGPLGAFITPGHARELALTPGTTLHRLLTDPADGRLVERSIPTYRPDTAMRRQIIAADVHSRAPGSRQPATSCELDHVEPWAPEGAGGPTTETNLAAIHVAAHQRKTTRLWTSTINTRRDLTWTTLLAATHTTRAYDYRQHLHHPPTNTGVDPNTTYDDEAGRRHQAQRYAQAHLTLVTGSTRGQHHSDDPASPPGPHPATIPTEDPGHRELSTARDLANRALYAALVHRGPDGLLQDEDDTTGAGDHGGPLAGWMFITRTHPVNGRQRPGTPTNHPTPEHVLGIDITPDPPTDHQQPENSTGHGLPWDTPPENPPPF